MKKDLLVPDIGDFENVEIIELLVKKGQKITINDPIVTLESDKSSVEVPSTEEGIVENISIKIGDKVSKGDKLISISVEGGSEKIEETKEVKKEQEILGGIFDKSNYVADRLWATADDGTKIPISLVRHIYTALTSKTPLLQYLSYH